MLLFECITNLNHFVSGKRFKSKLSPNWAAIKSLNDSSFPKLKIKWLEYKFYKNGGESDSVNILMWIYWCERGENRKETKLIFVICWSNQLHSVWYLANLKNQHFFVFVEYWSLVGLISSAGNIFYLQKQKKMEIQLTHHFGIHWKDLSQMDCCQNLLKEQLVLLFEVELGAIELVLTELVAIELDWSGLEQWQRLVWLFERQLVSW